MNNILQKLLSPILQQAQAAVQLPGAMWQARNPQNLLPKEGFVFGKKADGSTDPKYQISRELLGKNILGSNTRKPAGMTDPVAKTGPGFTEPMQQPKGSDFAQVAPSPSPIAKLANAMFGRTQKAQGLKPSQDVVNAITAAAKAYDLPVDLMFDIAAQESMFDPNARAQDNGFDGTNLPFSSASGLYQFTDGTWDTVRNYGNMPGNSLKMPNWNRMDPYANAMAAAYLIKNGQLGRWDASRGVWGEPYAGERANFEQYYAQTPDSFASWR